MRRGQAEQAKARPAFGLYLHVPFCAATCGFCAFHQNRPDAAAVRAFLGGVERELDLLGAECPPPLTVFWGGGTPGLLPVPAMRRLAGAMRARWPSAPPPAEWSVEMAPGSVTEARLGALREAGAGRISLGVQSLQPRLLEALGRRHSVRQVRRAYELIRAGGFRSVNLDLMFALPGQSGAEWRGDIAGALEMAPDHISTYCLTFEEDTAMWTRLSQGRVRRDIEAEADMYEDTWRILEKAGYPQYEVSNFARPGHACLHNLNTWRMQEWAGIGPSAASQQDGWRGANPPDLKLWLAGLEEGRRMTSDRVRLTPPLLAADSLVFGLRMNEGVDTAALRRRFPGAVPPAVDVLLERLAEGGLLRGEGDGRVVLTPAGRLVADAVGAEILAAFD